MPPTTETNAIIVSKMLSLVKAYRKRSDDKLINIAAITVNERIPISGPFMNCPSNDESYAKQKGMMMAIAHSLHALSAVLTNEVRASWEATIAAGATGGVIKPITE